MDKYDEMYTAFMRKANLLGMNIEFEKQKNRLYKLNAIEWNGDRLILKPFIGKIDHSALENCPNLVELYLPDTLTSLDIYYTNGITKYNLPSKIRGMHRFGYDGGKIEVTLEGCRKSVQSGFSSNKLEISIINSHLIERINRAGFYQYRNGVTTVKELRLLDTFIETNGFFSTKIEKLYISKYSKIERRAFTECEIKELYFFVETQEEANAINNLFYNEAFKLSQFSNCIIKKLMVIVRPTLRQDIRSLTGSTV